MKIAFDFGNTLVERGSGRPERFVKMRALWNSLAKEHELIIITHINPAGYASPQHSIDANTTFVNESIREFQMATPAAIFHVIDDKRPILEREKPDIFVDDLDHWCNAAAKMGICTLKVV